MDFLDFGWFFLDFGFVVVGGGSGGVVVNGCDERWQREVELRKWKASTDEREKKNEKKKKNSITSFSRKR